MEERSFANINFVSNIELFCNFCYDQMKKVDDASILKYPAERLIFILKPLHSVISILSMINRFKPISKLAQSLRLISIQCNLASARFCAIAFF